MTARPLHVLLSVVVLAACQASVDLRPPAVADDPAETLEASRTMPTQTPTTASARPTATAAAATPVPTPATPSPIVTPVPPPAVFALDLYREGDFVPQHTFEWCVGASIQMAHNMVADTVRSSYEDQRLVWEMARDRSSNSFRGANPRGWAAALDALGIGPYQLVSIPDYDEALRTAAAAIHATSRPVGLVMWRGRHAWVMSGFESIGDPAIHPDFTVSGIRVLDPLYPHGSGTWGPSPAPNSLLSPDELARQFVVREPRRWSSDLPTGYLLVLPVEG